jgi:ATP-dependent DNA helicase RecG
MATVAEGGGLDRPVRLLRGVGPQRADLLGKMGIGSVRDLLLHLPRAYLDRTTILPISELRPGADATTIARIVSLSLRRPRGRIRDVTARLRDDTGDMTAIWFNAPYLTRLLHAGDRLLLSGRLSFWRGLQLVHPEFEILPGEEEGEEETPARIVPVYPSTAGLGQRAIRSLVGRAMGEVALLEDPLPEGITRRLGFPPRPEALRMIHLPLSIEEAEHGRTRLAFEEILFLQLLLQRARRLRTAAATAHRLDGAGARLEEIRLALPYRLTAGQEGALGDILGDLTRDRPALRLLQGEVGSGKTVVAAMACAWAAGSGAQAGFLLPTEVLALQQQAVLARLLEPAGCRVSLLLGRTPAAERRRILEDLRSGKIELLVGTHAVLEEDVRFQKLGLVVVDEQHRFGVLQRLRLLEKGPSPHLLVMSATPIPRTLALAYYGDLEITSIREIPPGRTPIRTRLVDRDRWDEMLLFVGGRLRNGQQAFFVYPLVEESERIDLRDATRMHKEISSHPALRGLEIALLHGRTPAEERERILRGLSEGRIAGLVATTVIEVGIDLPRATVMVVEHPERFGLSQLHQLRGRIGRAPGETPYFFLVREDGPAAGDPERLSVLVRESDGFRIAEEDLRLRGPGELLGTRQTGLPAMKIADLSRDATLLSEARAVAEEILSHDPNLDRPEGERLWREILRQHPLGLRFFGVA